MKQNKIIMLGPQGSGKGTQATRLSQKLGVPAVSMGQLLRDEVASGSGLADEISAYIDEGHLVSDELALRVLKKRLKKDDCQHGYILDGYPRNMAQYEVSKELEEPDAVLVLDVAEEVSLKRLTHRAEVEGRKDDTTELIKERLRVYHEETEPVIEKYKKDGLVHVVDGVGTMEEVENRIDDALDIHIDEDIP